MQKYRVLPAILCLLLIGSCSGKTNDNLDACSWECMYMGVLTSKSAETIESEQYIYSEDEWYKYADTNIVNSIADAINEEMDWSKEILYITQAYGAKGYFTSIPTQNQSM